MGRSLSQAEQRAADAIARFQHANESLHRHPTDGVTCGYCDLVGRYAVLTLASNPELLAGLVAEAAGMEPFGLVWRPEAGSRRWQHRTTRDGRSYPATAEFVDVYRLTDADGTDG